MSFVCRSSLNALSVSGFFQASARASPLGSSIGRLASQRSVSSSLRLFHTAPVARARQPPPPPEPFTYRLRAAPRPGLDKHPDAEPLNEADLVNPSGRIYSPSQAGPSPEDFRAGSDVDLMRERLGRAQAPKIGRAVLVALGLSMGAYAIAAAYSVSERERVQGLNSGSSWGDFSSFFGAAAAGTLDERRLREARRHEMAQKAAHGMAWAMGWCDQLGLPRGVKEVVGNAWLICAENYLELPSFKQCLVPIIAVNAVVFVAWRFSGLRSLGSLRRFMDRTMVHSPTSGRHYTMLTSTFSHNGGLHFLFNQLALWSFGAAAFLAPAFYANSHVVRTPETTTTPHFIAFFVAAGLFSALFSHVASAVQWRLLARRTTNEFAKVAMGTKASLGSSGAVYSAVVMTALAFPDNKIGLIFLPFVYFPIGAGVLGLVTLDVAGILFRWKMFDHWAHLGGALFGLLYWFYGAQWWQSQKAWAQMGWSTQVKQPEAVRVRI